MFIYSKEKPAAVLALAIALCPTADVYASFQICTEAYISDEPSSSCRLKAIKVKSDKEDRKDKDLDGIKKENTPCSPPPPCKPPA